MSNLGFPGCGLSLESHQHFIPTHVVSALMVLSSFFGFLKPSDTLLNIFTFLKLHCVFPDSDKVTKRL